MSAPADRPSPAMGLRECPFCGSGGAMLEARDDADQGYKWGSIQCGECSAKGPEVRTGYDKPEKWRPAAITEWNRRAASEDAERLRSAQDATWNEAVRAVEDAIDELPMTDEYGDFNPDKVYAAIRSILRPLTPPRDPQ